jgi:hypothetical protein
MSAAEIMKERENHSRGPFVPHQQPAEGAEPGNGLFDDPAMSIGAQAATAFVPTMPIIVAVRTRQHDGAGGEALPQRIAVVRPVAEQVVGIAAV